MHVARDLLSQEKTPHEVWRDFIRLCYNIASSIHTTYIKGSGFSANILLDFPLNLPEKAGHVTQIYEY